MGIKISKKYKLTCYNHIQTQHAFETLKLKKPSIYPEISTYEFVKWVQQLVKTLCITLKLIYSGLMLRFFLRGQGHQGIFFPVGKHPQTKSTFQGDARPAIASFVLLRANLVQSSSFNYLQSASHTKISERLGATSMAV